jgi:hypothetical protein
MIVKNIDVGLNSYRPRTPKLVHIIDLFCFTLLCRWRSTRSCDIIIREEGEACAVSSGCDACEFEAGVALPFIHARTVICLDHFGHD